MSRLLITGATGFIGQQCVNRAAKSRFAVHAVARRPVEYIEIPYHPVNLFDFRAVSEFLASVRPTHLLHLAWIATPGTYWTSPENRTWVEASKHLMQEFAACGGKRAVITGTCIEYDWQIGGVCREFETPTKPTSLYGQCKTELREWCTTYSKQAGLSLAWARLFFLYGPNEHPARLVASVARALLAGEKAECTAGTQVRDFLHTADLADALIALLESDMTGPINIGSGQAVSLKQVIETIGVVCDRPELIRLGARPTPPTEPPLLVPDVTRLREELGWKPRISLEQGLTDTVDWWRARHAA